MIRILINERMFQTTIIDLLQHKNITSYVLKTEWNGIYGNEVQSVAPIIKWSIGSHSDLWSLIDII